MLNQKLRLLSYVVMGYMLLAFTWWALLLFTKNRDAFHAKRDLMKIGMVAEGMIQNNEEFESTTAYEMLHANYKKQEWMIFGEASVFVLTLIAGLWFIHRSYYQAVRTNEYQRNFLLSITHELKSPISSIRLVLETLIKRTLPKEKSDQLAASALKENERLHQLVENLLLSAKLESTPQPNFEELNLDDLLEDILAKYATRHPTARIDFKRHGNIPLARMDRSWMVLLINNLMENAIKYADGTPEIEVELKASKNQLHLSFADHGIGIPDQEKEQVFQKFYRVGSEETRKTKGTGLGLFIVYQIVKAHNGRIFIRDNQPKGTVFNIEWPIIR